jgi:hypothetical protein
MKITIKNWSRFQHYKARRPPWVRLHRSLLDDRAFAELSDFASRLLVLLWLIASETKSDDGTITGDVEDIAFRVHRDVGEVLPALQELALRGFVQMGTDDASTMLADRQQVAPESCPETETETEKKQTRRKRRVYPSEFLVVWNIHRRGPKAKAHDEWRRAVGEVITQEELLTALRGYVGTLTPDFQGVHLFRYIRDARWEEGGGDVPGVLKRNILTSAPMKVMP